VQKGSGKGSGFLLNRSKFWLLHVGAEQRVAIIADLLSIVLLNHGDARSGLLCDPLLVAAECQAC
jgi:hypothetical protein